MLVSVLAQGLYLARHLKEPAQSDAERPGPP